MRIFDSFRDFIQPVRDQPQVGIMLAIVGLVMSGNALVAPVLSLYATTFASSSTLVGMVITIFGFARLFVNYPAGVLSQRIGRRPLLGVGPAVIVVGSVGAALTTTIEWLLFWRFVQGVGSGIYMTVSYAAMADLAPPEARGRVMALQQACTWLGIGLGPVIGGVLAQHFGLSTPFWAYGAVCAAATLIVCLKLQETNEASKPSSRTATAERPAPAEKSVPLRKIPIFVVLCAITTGSFFTRTASQWLLIPLLAHDRHGLSVDLIGVALAVTAIGTFAILPATGNLIDRYGAQPVIVFATLITAIALVVIALGPTAMFFWAGMFLLGIGLGVSGPAISAYSISVVPKENYGPAMGMLRTCGDVGFVFGPLLVGMLDDFGDMGAIGGILFNAALLSVLTIPFLLRMAGKSSTVA